MLWPEPTKQNNKHFRWATVRDKNVDVMKENEKEEEGERKYFWVNFKSLQGWFNARISVVTQGIFIFFF